MSTRTKGLGVESTKTLHGICKSIYLDGECYAFAIALHEGLGWPIIGVMDANVIRHAVVRSPAGTLHDARGEVSIQELGHPFGLSFPYEMREVRVDELSRVGETEENRLRSVMMAQRLAEAVWPDLPWRDSKAKRVQAFCDELEGLCRRHNLWIRSPYPAAKPMLAVGESDEGGYEIRLTDDGLTYTIDRYLV